MQEGIRMLALALALSTASDAVAANWLRPSPADPRPIWGTVEGIRFAVSPGSVEGPLPDDGGPRGLIRIGYPAAGDQPIMLNFVAIEPTANGKREFSELQESQVDHRPGKILTVKDGNDPGDLSTGPDGVETLTVRIDVERFTNGAHVFVLAAIHSDRPGEIDFTVHPFPDSAPMSQCVLTATMGNKTRVRHVELGSGALDSIALFGGLQGNGFSDDNVTPASRLARNKDGDVVVPFNSNENDPGSVHPFPEDPFAWYYPGRNLTQYWRKPKESPQANLRLRVNGRAEYWGSQQAIPGGVAFENVELQDNFADGERWVFGISPASPREVIDGPTHP